MKKYLFTTILTLGLLVTNNVHAQESETDLDTLQGEIEAVKETLTKLQEQLNALREEESLETDKKTDEYADTPMYKGSMKNPYTIGETATFDVMTEYYEPYDETATGLEMLLGSFITSVVETYDGLGQLEIIEVQRGEEALSILEEYEDVDNNELQDGYEYALISFSFDWLESESDFSMYLSAYEFEVFGIDGSYVNNDTNYVYFDGMFDMGEVYPGGNVSGTFAKVVPEGEPFLIRFGNDYYIEQMFFEVE